jgi:hypothetical protein
MRKLPSVFQRGWVVSLLVAAVLLPNANPAGLAQAQRSAPLDPDAIAESWSPVPSSTFTLYNDGTTPSITVRVFGDPSKSFDTATALYRVYNSDGSPRTPYTAPARSLMDSNNTIVMTVTTQMLLGTGMTIDFYVNYTTPLQTPMKATYHLKTTTSYHLPIVVKPYPYLEPNSNPCQAVVAAAGTTYVDAPDDAYDFFRFTIPTTSTVAFNVTNFVVGGEMQFRMANGNIGACSPTDSTTLVQSVSMPPSAQTLTQLRVSPGTYFARLSTTGTISSTPYNFSWTYVPVPDSPLEPNDNPCQATVAAAGVPYAGAPNDTYDFFQFTVPTTATVYFTLTNFTVPGQMQFRIANSNIGVCSPTDSTNVVSYVSMPPNEQTLMQINVSPGTYFARLSTVIGGQTSDTPYTFTWNWMQAPSSPLEPNDNPCQATTANAGVSYIGAPNDKYDFFQLTVPTTSTVYFTTTNFTVAGQMQFRMANSLFATCSPTASTTIVSYVSMPPSTQTLVQTGVTPGIYFARLSTADAVADVPYSFQWNAVQANSVMEPNNTACAAWPIATGQTYQAYPDDNEDWYSFDVTRTSTIQLATSNYSATGQFFLYRQNTACSDIAQVTYVAQSAGGFIVSGQPAGHYFIRIATSAGWNINVLYAFQVGVISNWEPNSDTCFPLGGCAANKTGGNLTAYWQGMYGVTYLRISLEGRGPVGSCPKGTSSNGVNPALADNGNTSFTGIARGYYVLHVDANGPSDELKYRGELPIKMDCDFRTNRASPVTPEITPTPIPYITPAP